MKTVTVDGQELTLEEAQAFTKTHGYKQGADGRWWRGDPLRTETPDGSPRCWHAGTTYGGANRQCHMKAKTTLADGSTWCGNHDPAAKQRVVDRRNEKARIRRQRSAHRDKLVEEEARKRRAYDTLAAALVAIRDGDNDARGTAARALQEIGHP